VTALNPPTLLADLHYRMAHTNKSDPRELVAMVVGVILFVNFIASLLLYA
jgi:hypothetical protein